VYRGQIVANAQLLLTVDRDSDLPVGVQLAWRLRSLIAAGKLGPGEQLPSVRELAELAGVNANTARAIYGRLEAEGLLVSRHGLGTFVAADTRPSADVERIAAEAVAEARRAGISPSDVARSIYGASWADDDPRSAEREPELPDVGVEADEAAARRELRRQIARLEAELAAYPEARSQRDRHPLLRPKGHVASFSELSATRDEMIELLREARREAERRGERQARARGRRERIIGDPEAHRWARVGNDDCGDPGCGETRSVPRFGPIGAIAGWWRVKVSSGCP
jgi:DNA-binding transcriptional regulator YhcF (GntR family)